MAPATVALEVTWTAAQARRIVIEVSHAGLPLTEAGYEVVRSQHEALGQNPLPTWEQLNALLADLPSGQEVTGAVVTR